MTRTLSIAIKEKTYQELKQKIGPGRKKRKGAIKKATH
jgi:hypothetical protein